MVRKRVEIWVGHGYKWKSSIVAQIYMNKGATGDGGKELGWCGINLWLFKLWNCLTIWKVVRPWKVVTPNGI